MRKRLLAALVMVLALAVVLASCGGGSSTTIHETTVMRKSQRPTGMTYLPDVATGRHFVKPATYRFSVDGDLIAKSLDWHGWGEATATAFGTIAEHPANGLVDTFSGSVTAAAPKTCKGAYYYTQVMAHVPKQADFVPTEPTKLTTPCD